MDENASLEESFPFVLDKNYSCWLHILISSRLLAHQEVYLFPQVRFSNISYFPISITINTLREVCLSKSSNEHPRCAKCLQSWSPYLEHVFIITSAWKRVSINKGHPFFKVFPLQRVIHDSNFSFLNSFQPFVYTLQEKSRDRLLSDTFPR